MGGVYMPRQAITRQESRPIARCWFPRYRNPMSEQSPKPKMSTGAKWGLGCGVGCLSLMVLLAVGGFVAYRIGMKYLGRWEADFHDRGFTEIVKSHAIDITEPVETPTLFLAQIVKVMAPCPTNMAIIAQMAEVHSRIEGTLYFRGQLLVIQPGGELMNGLDVQAQAIQNYGAIEGDITGTFQSIDIDTIP